MADTTNLSQFLSDVADAIRTKKETTEQIPAENFDQEILSIETGIDTSDATAEANDIIAPKTAYVNGEKITGNIGLIEKESSSSIVYNTTVIKTGFHSPTYYDAYAVGNITMFVYVSDNNLTCVVMKNNTLLLEKSFAISEVFSFSTVQTLALNLVSNTTSQIIFDVGIAYKNGSNYQYSFNTLTINLLDNSLTLGTKISTSFSGSSSGSGNTLWSVKTKPGRFVSIVKFNSDDRFLYVTTDWSTKKATVIYASLYHGYDYNPNAKITGNYKWLIQPKYAEYLDTNTTVINSYSNAAGTNNVYISPGNNYMFVNNVLYKITPNTNYNTMYNSRTKIADITASVAFFTEKEDCLYVRATSSIDIYKLTTNTATLVQTIPYTNHTLAYIYGTTSFLVFDDTNTELVLFHVSTATLTVEGLVRQGQNFIKLTELDVPNTSNVLEDVEYKNQNGDYIKGTMPNNGELNYTPSIEEQTIPAGYTSGGKIEAVTNSIDSNIVAENIKKDVSILGVTGILESGVMTEEEYNRCKTVSNLILVGDTEIYKELEYIESTGSEYINTGVKENVCCMLEFEFKPAGVKTINQSYLSGTLDNFTFAASGAENNVYLRYRTSEKFYTTSIDPSVKNSFSIMDNKIILNNTIMSSVNTNDSVGTNSNNILIFDNASLNRRARMRFYSLKLYDKNKNLLRDFIPVKNNATGKAGLYDKVEDKFYGNSGTGDFIMGGVV